MDLIDNPDAPTMMNMFGENVDQNLEMVPTSLDPIDHHSATLRMMIQDDEDDHMTPMKRSLSSITMQLGDCGPEDGGQSENPMNIHHNNNNNNQCINNNSSNNVVYQLVYPSMQMTTTSVPISTHMYSRPLSPVLPMPLPMPETAPTGHTIPVSCGNCTGVMYLSLFLCPGIHQPCIEFEGQLLSPKQFTVRGEKEKQKDWKASIRIGKSSLRAHMEAYTMDFYEHPQRCSGKCQSRNYVHSPMEREEVLQMRRAKRTAEQMFLRSELCKELDKSMKGEIGTEVVATTTAGDDYSSQHAGMDLTAMPPQPPRLSPENMEGMEEADLDMPPPLRDELEKRTTTTPKRGMDRKGRGRPRGSQNRPRTTKKLKMEHQSDYQKQKNDESEGVTPFQTIMDCLQSDPSDFWNQMHKTSVISHFCDDIIVSAINLKQSVLSPESVAENVAKMLTNAVFAFGIEKNIVQRVQSIERSVNTSQRHRNMSGGPSQGPGGPIPEMLARNLMNEPSTSREPPTAVGEYLMDVKRELSHNHHHQQQRKF